MAVANLFPQFSLTGSIAREGLTLQSLGRTANQFWAIGPSVNWPLFQGGAVLANIEVQKALQEQAGLAYQKAVLTALQDVEDALAAYDQEQKHNQALRRSVQANSKAVDLAVLLYRQGQSDFLSVLTAEQSLYVAQNTLAQSDSALSADVVALYKALGGGWNTDAPADSARP